MIKKILYVLIAALVIIQFIRPKQNVSAGPFTNDISTKFAVNDNVASIALINNNPTFNPVEKWAEAIEENKKLYERLLQAEREKVTLLEKMLEIK